MSKNETVIGSFFTDRAKVGFYYRRASYTNNKYITFKFRFLFINIEIEKQIEIERLPRISKHWIVR